MKNLVFVADAHINENPKEVSIFRNFLQKTYPTTGTLCILGDLFDLWVAKKRLEQDYHSNIIDQLRALKMAGVRLLYIEGNRDFHIRHCYLGDPFDAVSNGELAEEFDGRRFYLSHGDMVNTDDKAYLFWRRISKSRFVWRSFNVLPLSAEAVMAKKIKRMLKETNIKYRSYFPYDKCRAFGERMLNKSFDIVVIGHLHKQEIFEFNINGSRRLLYSMPAWKDEKRYLLFEPGKEGRFVDFQNDTGSLFQ
ncbi:MAG: metallophosphoesterase [Acidobacteriota bacterium]